MEALSSSSASNSKRHRRELGVLLAGCASPTIAKARYCDGTERRICKRLRVPRGCRCAKSGLRPYAYRQAALRRAVFAAARRKQMEQVVPVVGDVVHVGACGSEGKLIEIGAEGQCKIEFSCGDMTEVHEYATLGMTKETRKLPGSARVRHILPPLEPPEFKPLRDDAVASGLAQRIDKHARSRCAESPHTRDLMSRRVAPRLHEREQALIKTEPVEEMFGDFKQQCHEGQGCRLSTYKNFLPWNIKDAYRETCLCASCESQRLHMEGMRVAASLLKPVVSAAEAAQEAAEEAAALRRQQQRDAAAQAEREAAERRARTASELAESLEPIGGAAADAAELDGNPEVCTPLNPPP